MYRLAHKKVLLFSLCVTNKEVLVHANEARSILKTILCSKHRWLGHILRHDNLLHDIIEGKMLGKATQGRKMMGVITRYDGKGRLWTVERFISDRSRWRRKVLWCFAKVWDIFMCHHVWIQHVHEVRRSRLLVSGIAQDTVCESHSKEVTCVRKRASPVNTRLKSAETLLNYYDSSLSLSSM